MECAAIAKKGIGATFAKIVVAKVVIIHLADKVMDIARIVKANTGENCVTRHVAKIVLQIVIKAMEIVVAVGTDSGERIVINFVLTTVHHQAVLEQQDTAAPVRLVSGVCIVTRRATMVVLQAVTCKLESAATAKTGIGATFAKIVVVKVVIIHLAEKVMDIARIVKANTGENCVTRHAAKIVPQIVIKAMEIVVAVGTDSGERIVINFVHTTVHHQAVLEQQDTAAAVRPAPGVCIVTRRVA